MTTTNKIIKELEKKYGYKLSMKEAANELHIDYSTLSRSNIERFRMGKSKYFKVETIAKEIIQKMA